MIFYINWQYLKFGRRINGGAGSHAICKKLDLLSISGLDVFQTDPKEYGKG
jgi:hypothetical protein